MPGRSPAPSRPGRDPVPPAARSGPDGPDSALPSVGARVLAFASVLVGGLAGGFIGYAFGELGGFGSVMIGLLTVAGAALGAGGVSVVAVLTLRALGEWETIRRKRQ